MTPYLLTPFHPLTLLLAPLDEEARWVFACVPHIPLVEGYCHGPAYTLWRHQYPLVSFGMYPLTPFHGELWLVCTQYAAAYPVTVARTLLRHFLAGVETYQLQQVDAQVRAGCTVGRKLVTWLGLSAVQVLPLYLGNQDHILYRWRRDDGR